MTFLPVPRILEGASAMATRRKKRLRVALIYNSHTGSTPDRPGDLGGTAELKVMVRHLARALRPTGCEVVILPLSDDLLQFQRRLRRIEPDVVFNQ